MIDYKKNRIDYGKLLNPPVGFQLEFAVAATYTLDLLAFLSIPVALFYSKNLDGNVSENRMDILDSIQKTSDKVKIYCQKSKIYCPDNNVLISFVEDSIHEILPDNANISFHPKFWVIRYRGKDKTILYRVIVLSRNLTFDRSWDVAFFLEGFMSENIIENNSPFAEYLKYLSNISDFNNSIKFISDFKKVDFVVDNPFSSFSFHPMGFESHANPLKDDKFKDLIIISPFLDKTTLNYFSNSKIVSGKKYLFSRSEELDKIHLDDLNDYDVYSLSDRVVDGENDDELSEESNEDTQSQNLHAKLYIGSKTDSKSRWYLGSANFSNAAMNRNEEFLISLDSRNSPASPDEILKLLLSNENKLDIFEKYERKTLNPVVSDEFDFRVITFSFLKYLENQNNVVAVCENDSQHSNLFNIKIEFEKNKLFDLNDFEISCAPYGCKRDLKIVIPNLYLVFKGIALHNLSPFLIFNILHKPTGQCKEFMTRSPIKLPDNRKQAIFRSIIDNKEKFFEFIQFLLGNNEGQFEFIGKKLKVASSWSESSNIWHHSQPLFEELLLASSRDKDKLFEIDNVIKKLQKEGADDLIPEDFMKFWNVFLAVLNDG